MQLFSKQCYILIFPNRYSLEFSFFSVTNRCSNFTKTFFWWVSYFWYLVVNTITAVKTYLKKNIIWNGQHCLQVVWRYHLIFWSFPLTSTLLVSSVLGEQCNGGLKGSIWPVMNQKIELIVVGQCSMMSEMSWGLGLCVHRHSPWIWKGSVLFGGYKRELCSGIGMAR